MMIQHQHINSHVPHVVNSANSRAKDELRKSGMLLTVQRWLVALFCLLSIFSAQSAQLSTRYSYDEAGNKTSQTDALGHITRWTYSLTNQITSRTLPDGSSESFSYDSQGNRTSYTDFNGQITRYGYDLNDRLTLTQYPDGRSIKTTYAPSGQIDTITESQLIAGKTTAKVTRYSYDIMDRLLKVEYPNKQIISYSCDAAGRLLSRSTANGTTRYTYDVMDQLTTVTDAQSGVTSYEYDATGNKTKKTLANGQYSTYGYNSRHQLSDIQHYRADQSLIAQYQYTLNDTGLRTQVIENQADINNANQNHSRTVNYGYDSLNRLTQETALDPDNAFGGSYSRTYGYDSVGNRSQQIHTQGQAETITTDYQYDANDQLLTETIHSPTATDTLNYLYDKNGNLTQKANQNGVLARYRYTPDNKLSQIEQGSMTIRYAYDADGNRIQSTKTDNSQNLAQTTTNYLVDSNFTYPEIVEEQDTQGKLTASHTFSPTGAGDLLSITRANQGTYYASEDALGSLRQLTNTQGKVEAQQQTTAWGEVLPVSNVNQYTNYGYTGERQDPITGLVYLRAREYAPSTGRFVQRDSWEGTLRNPLTLNQYMYANADGVNRTDPSGYFTLMDEGIANSIRQDLTALEIRAANTLLDAGTVIQFDGEGLTAREIAVSTVNAFAGGALGKWFKTTSKYCKSSGNKCSVPVLGGSYKPVRTWATENGKGGEVHHMPSYYAVKGQIAPNGLTLSRDRAPSIWMTQADHYLTASHSGGGAAYRERQKQSIMHGDWCTPILEDILDVSSISRVRYAAGIGEYLLSLPFIIGIAC